MKRTILTFALLAGLLFAASAQATLIDRGNGLIYDTVLDITWTQNANLCVTLNNCIPGPGGLMTWSNAVAWADGLVYQGFPDWRLPSMDVNGDSTVVGCTTNVDCPDNEYGHMYYQNLGGTGNNKTGSQGGDGGVTLDNIQSFYWSGTAAGPVDAWGFNFGDGVQIFFRVLENQFNFAWAVRPGDSVSVPEPASLLLLGMGLAGLGLARWYHRRGV